MSPASAPVCYALLDDRNATEAHPLSRLYTGLVREHVCPDPAQLEAVWAAADADLRAGLHAVLLADYEWGARLLKAGTARLGPADGALRVLMFSNLRHLSRSDVDHWLAEQEPSAEPGPAGVMNLRPSVDPAQFTQAIHHIHEAIRAGETYQVNYTYRLQGEAHGSPVALYRRLRTKQPVNYGALIGLPVNAGDAANTQAHVLSCSPELFIRHQAGQLTARPMKGTASRAVDAEGDSETARLLSLDVKNRAENLMIVDLLRNDLGRLAQIGTVKVPQLFDIEPYTTVFQMTSTVVAQVRPAVGMPELLRAVFPCGSITGAPKHHTMDLIEGLETTPRGLYCGAIGWVDAPAGEVLLGDFCLSVAIRTLTLGAQAQGSRPVRLGVGAGIVLDSVAADEYEECRLKARFVTALDPGFVLFETLGASLEQGARRAEAHLARLLASARALGFVHHAAQLAEALRQAVATLPAGTTSRLRLQLSHDGVVGITHSELPPLLTERDGRVALLIAPDALPSGGASPLAAHKTSLRAHYDAGICAAEAAAAFDSLFFNTAGRLVEGGRSNVFLQLEGCWFTPPLNDGALPGVMRAQVLADPAWAATERSLTRADLARASALMVCSSLRGVLPAVLTPAALAALTSVP